MCGSQNVTKIFEEKIKELKFKINLTETTYYRNINLKILNDSPIKLPPQI